MRHQEWRQKNGHVVVLAARVQEMEDAFHAEFGKSLEDAMKEHGWEPRWDDSGDEEPVNGRTSLIGLNQMDKKPTFLTDEFEKTLRVLSPFLFRGGWIEFESNGQYLKIVMENGGVGFQRPVAYYIYMEDPGSVKFNWVCLTYQLLRLGVDPGGLKKLVDESTCTEIIEQ